MADLCVDVSTVQWLATGFACIALFSVATSLFIATASPILLAIVYVPVICGSALIIGPVQSFALSKLTPELNPHGVTVMSTGFQIAGCIGSSVFTGIYAYVIASAVAGGAPMADAAAQGMAWSGGLVGLVAAIGFVLALVLRSFDRFQIRVAEKAAPAGASLAALMETDVFALNSDSTVLDAMRLFVEKGISGAPIIDRSGSLAGFVSDGDVMRCLGDQVPASKSAWSFVVEQGNGDFDAVARKAAETPLSQIATRRVVSSQIDTDLGALARLMADRHLKKVPIVDGGTDGGYHQPFRHLPLCDRRLPAFARSVKALFDVGLLELKHQVCLATEDPEAHVHRGPVLF